MSEKSIAKFGLIVIGDEILSGKRQDAHFSNMTKLLGQYHLSLDWAHYLGDNPTAIVALLQQTMASEDVVFCTGGIGPTPDDHTRRCVAQVAGVPLMLHPEAEALIAQRILDLANGDAKKSDFSQVENRRRFEMGMFPAGAQVIPNGYNSIPGFSLGRHYFFPGFPVMTEPMMDWVLKNFYARDGRVDWQEYSFFVFGVSEAILTPLMEDIEQQYPGVKVFSLPSLGEGQRGAQWARPHIELGVKGIEVDVTRAWAQLSAAVRASGAEVISV